MLRCHSLTLWPPSQTNSLLYMGLRRDKLKFIGHFQRNRIARVMYHCFTIRDPRRINVDTIIASIQEVVGRDAVLSEPDELLVYECDGLPQHKYRPRAVVFPSSTEETAAVMRVLAEERVPFTPRGAGTGLSGGALALNKGIVIELARMRHILKIDEANRTAVVQ